MKNDKKMILVDWCKSNGLEYYELLSIVFIPYRTIDNFFYDGRRALAALYRMHKITGLDIFKMSDSEIYMFEKQMNQKDSVEYWDALIAEKFISDWQLEKKVPALHLRLITTRQNSQKKDVLVKKIKAELFSDEIIKTIVSKPAVLNHRNDSTQNVLAYLDNVTNFNESDLLNFVKQNKKDLKKLASVVNTLISEDPIHAIKNLKQSKIFFKQLNPTINDK